MHLYTVPSATLLQIKEGTEELLVHSGVVCSSQCYVSYTNSRYIYLPGVVFTPGDLVRSRRVVDDITVLVILQQQAFNPVAFMLQWDEFRLMKRAEEDLGSSVTGPTEN